MSNLGDNPLAGKIDEGRFTTMYSGQKFYYSNFKPHDILLSDIATHLAKQTRWLGALHVSHYSTAEHSVKLAHYIQWKREEINPIDRVDIRRIALAFLMHDAEEFVTGDFPSPFKALVPEVKPYGEYVRKVIFDKFDIPYEYYSLVKPYDMAIRVTEAETWLKGGAAACEANPEHALNVTLSGWNWHAARDMFMKTFEGLF